MKYFTYDLWKSFNSSNETARNRANDEWIANIELYKEEFRKLDGRLTKSFLKVFSKNDNFHDFNFSEFKIYQISKDKYPLVSFKLTDDDKTYEIIYKDVRKVCVNYSADTNELGFGNGLCTCGYNEFLEVNDKLISHEILFSSGVTILIWFTKVKVNSIK